MATQGKILVYKRQGKKGTTYTYRLEAGRDPITGKRKRVSKSGFKTAKEARAAAQPILNKFLVKISLRVILHLKNMLMNG